MVRKKNMKREKKKRKKNEANKIQNFTKKITC